MPTMEPKKVPSMDTMKNSSLCQPFPKPMDNPNYKTLSRYKSSSVRIYLQYH